MVYLLAIAVCVLPIQVWTDALPRYPGGVNFQNLITIALVVGWIVDCTRRGVPLVPKSPLNKAIFAYVVWTFLALFYGWIFTPQVGLPLSLSDPRVIHWKDEMTGVLIFFVAQATLRDERRVRTLLFLMLATVPYIIGVYHYQYTAEFLERHRTFGVDEVMGDDDVGSRTGVPGARYVEVINADGNFLSIIVDSEHRLRAWDADGATVEVEGRTGPATISLPGWSRSRGPITISYTHDRRGSGTTAQTFSWELKTITGVFSQIGSNEMASFYANALLVLVGLIIAWRGARWWRLYLAANALLLAWGTIFSLSRGAWLAVAAAIAYLGARRNRALMVGFVVFIVAAPTLMPGSVTTRTGIGDDSAQGRLEYWKWAAYAGTVRYPLGVGYQCYVPKHREETGIKLDTHNFFFRTLAEMGLIGLILVLRMFWRAFRTSWRLVDAAHTPFARALGIGVAIMWIGSFIANMFGDRFAYISINCYIWGFTGMALAELHRAGQETARLAEATAAEDDAESDFPAPAPTPAGVQLR
ncbi:MAG TPA: O-antigen ligase family protein [Polyangia bacterium]|jgi:hypothetical protein